MSNFFSSWDRYVVNYNIPNFFRLVYLKLSFAHSLVVIVVVTQFKI
jgi:hypothetical protein